VKSKSVLQRTLILAILMGLVITAAVLFVIFRRSPEVSLGGSPQSSLVAPLNQARERTQAAITLAQKESGDSNLPVRIKIPRIDVDAAIDYVGLTPEGKMDITDDPEDGAWYEPGPRPGEVGSAVIAGHYGTWADGQGSVFDLLHTLKKGDKVYVEDKAGNEVTFVVRESRRFEPDADATDVFTSDDGEAHLNLVTCEGEWNTEEERYSKRLVVFTDKE
jgi:sortase A